MKPGSAAVLLAFVAIATLSACQKTPEPKTVPGAAPPATQPGGQQ